MEWLLRSTRNNSFFVTTIIQTAVSCWLSRLRYRGCYSRLPSAEQRRAKQNRFSRVRYCCETMPKYVRGDPWVEDRLWLRSWHGACNLPPHSAPAKTCPRWGKNTTKNPICGATACRISPCPHDRIYSLVSIAWKVNLDRPLDRF